MQADSGGLTTGSSLPACACGVLRKRERAREDDDGCDALDIVVGYQTNSGTVGVSRKVGSVLWCLPWCGTTALGYGAL